SFPGRRPRRSSTALPRRRLSWIGCRARSSRRANACGRAWAALALLGLAAEPSAAADPVRPESAASKAAEAPRPPYVEAGGGPAWPGRCSRWRPVPEPRFSPSLAPAVHIALAVFPLAGVAAGGGLLSGLGVAGTLDKPVWGDAQARIDPSSHYGTSELRVEG